jgi:starch-binding outer membrane protein, SusD/RagB family
MKRIILCISITVVVLFVTACKKFLEVEPLDRVSGTQLFSDASGVKTVLATLYNLMPVEDFNFEPRVGFNYHGSSGGGNSDGGWSISGQTDHAVINSHGGSQPGTTVASYWDYSGIRQVNLFFATLASLTNIEENDRKRLESEGHFIRAYMYFTLARRFGGVPLVTEVQKLSSTGDNSALYVPRSTEKATWDFILNECDLAIANLPTTTSAVDGALRATKWAAYALQSRVALHAASVAKYWDLAPLTGVAVDAKLVGGMTIADANNYYMQCINASKAIMDNSGKQLFKPSPADKAEAAKNFQTIFENPSAADVEVIFKKCYIDGSSTSQQGHCTDLWFLPAQTKIGSLYMGGRYSPTLDLVDLFEDYTDDGTGKSAPVKTRTDGVENEYTSTPSTFVLTKPYIYYDNQYDIFANKDARLMGSIIVPGSTFKNTLMNMQGGLITTTGTRLMFTSSSAVGLDGKTYYAYGSSSPAGYSAYGNIGKEDENYSCTGFCLKKFLQEAQTVNANYWSSTQAWIDFRLAEIYLNYAEAVIESGQGDAIVAKACLNALRKRAGHTDQIPATLSNILKERQVELAFEGHRYWDLIRRRTYHTVFNATNRQALVPVLDLRKNPPKYLFVRAYDHIDVDAGARTFNPKSYYLSIPGVATNNLIQNPQY